MSKRSVSSINRSIFRLYLSNALQIYVFTHFSLSPIWVRLLVTGNCILMPNIALSFLM